MDATTSAVEMSDDSTLSLQGRGGFGSNGVAVPAARRAGLKISALDKGFAWSCPARLEHCEFPLHQLTVEFREPPFLLSDSGECGISGYVVIALLMEYESR